MTGFSNEVRELIRQRASYACEVQVRCQGRGMWWQLHHRIPRGMGGTKREQVNLAANGLGICADCHRWIEHNRAAAYPMGWLVRQTKDPADVPVLLRREWVYLNNIGGTVPTAVPCRCGLYESEHLSPNSPCKTYDPDAEASVE